MRQDCLGWRIILRWSLLAGALVDILFGFFILFLPSLLSAILKIPIPQETIYLRLCGLLLLGLGVVYALGFADPKRYFGNIVLAAILRLAGFVFFVGFVLSGNAPTVFLFFAIIEGALGVLHTIYVFQLLQNKSEN